MAAITPAPAETSGPPPMGLRERKKLKTRIAIRRATHRLVAEQGYEATTVEQIAEAAEVSPSTVFRYFPTKEDIVLSGGLHPSLETELRARPPAEDPLDSLRLVITTGLAAFTPEERAEAVLRTRLMVEVPAIRARMTESIALTSDLLVRALADRTGRPHGDLDVRVFTAAVLGALREVMLYWAARDHQDDLAELVDRALRTLRDGVRLQRPL
ncbi:TetR family transcriptional regulator [Streptomyces inusitatus]|uniref:TetR family transcriptional regulator n=1 Tax=Streptomyces inusitatus TaxID=68221 RepID=A0A918UL10_9ACTN|nr:TetR family transcriptional regulator [Streptomyces inusitatus]GGZ18197.1 TetR family transcriptional regulator [Streptomyces inusitatus]